VNFMTCAVPLPAVRSGHRRAMLGWSAWLLLGVFCGAAHAQPQPATAQIYTCVDAQGRKLTSDRPIRQCLDREQRILNPSGTVKGTLGPVLSVQERSAQEARVKADNEERVRQDEEKRRNRALLVRYPTPEAHQKERAEALAHVARVKQSAALRVNQLQQDKAKLTEEMAFYQKDLTKAPPKLRRQIDEVDQGLATQDRFMMEQDSESQRINSRFDEEYQRLLVLWRKDGATPHSSAVIPAKAGIQ